VKADMLVTILGTTLELDTLKAICRDLDATWGTKEFSAMAEHVTTSTTSKPRPFAQLIQSTEVSTNARRKGGHGRKSTASGEAGHHDPWTVLGFMNSVLPLISSMEDWGDADFEKWLADGLDFQITVAKPQPHQSDSGPEVSAYFLTQRAWDFGVTMKETWCNVSAEKEKLPANSESKTGPVTELRPDSRAFFGKRLDLINSGLRAFYHRRFCLFLVFFSCLASYVSQVLACHVQQELLRHPHCHHASSSQDD
jgi:hypothetical protein